MKDSTIAFVCFIAAIVVSIIGSFMVTGETMRTVLLGLSFAFGAAYMTGLAFMQKDDKKVEEGASLEINSIRHAA